MSSESLPSQGDPRGWQPPAAVVEQLDRDSPEWNFREERVQPYELPHVLARADGSQITSIAEWETTKRRDTLAIFAESIYGQAPAAPDPVQFRWDVVAGDDSALAGRAIRQHVCLQIPTQSGSFSVDLTLMIPTRRRGPAPLLLLVNNTPKPLHDWAARGESTTFWPFEEIIDRGYAAASFQTREVQPDDVMDSHQRGLIAAFTPPPRPANAWGNIAAWAWIASRIMDYLQTAPEIDAKRVAILGHSRGGKTALWAGAQDPRFAMVIAGESGLMGAKLTRRTLGERLDVHLKGRPYWYCENFQPYASRVNELPVDQHHLLALIAPRALYVASADEDLWADPRGEFLGLVHAGPAFELYGHAAFRPDEMPPLDTQIIRGRTGYHIRRGKHDLVMDDWRHYMNFADEVWR